jgi:hypothetical protein
VSTNPNAISAPISANIHPNSLANLIPARKGEIRNPNGGPKVKLFRKFAKRGLLADSGNGEQNIEHIVRRAIDEAVEGRDPIRAAEFLRDVVDGRPSADNADANSAAIMVNVLSFNQDKDE